MGKKSLALVLLSLMINSARSECGWLSAQAVQPALTTAVYDVREVYYDAR